MDYSPHLSRTPQTPRSRTSSSAPPTPHVGYTVPHRSPSRNHHYAGILMQHDSSNSDSSVGYISPTHRTTGTSYGTLQTEVSNNGLSTNRHIIAEVHSLDGDDLHPKTSLRKSVTWIWTIINMVVFGFCTFSLLQPNWLTNGSTRGSLGLLNYCEEGASLSTELEKCHYYITDNSLLPMLPSLSWQLATVLYTMALCILAISSLLSSICLCVSHIAAVNRISLVAGLQQLTAAILLATSLIIIPVGFDDLKVRETCGYGSALYNTGDCHIGWSYIIPTGCCVLSFTLPLLSHYVTYVPNYHDLT